MSEQDSNQYDDQPAEPDTTDANPADLPYKDDTSDGTTARRPGAVPPAGEDPGDEEGDHSDDRAES